MNNVDNVALFDMDGTLCNYHGKMIDDLRSISSPEDPPIEGDWFDEDKIPDYIRNRIKMIRNQPNWWFNLSLLSSGYSVYNIAREIGFRIHILTKGPYNTISAWSQKVQWVRENLASDTQITITEDKGLVYGKVLVDDYPPYIERWLEHRPRGLVIMPEYSYNRNFKHKNVIAYDYISIESFYKVKNALIKVYNRKSKEPLN